MGVNIEEVRSAYRKATGGEWKFDDMCYVWSGQQMLCQIRGWGHMTATLEMSEDEAIAQQDANAHLIVNMCSEDGWGKQMADELEQLRSENARLTKGIEVALSPEQSESPFDVLHAVLQGEDYREEANGPDA